MTDCQKKFRDRAMRLKRALGHEQQKYGFMNDSAGKRYEIGPLFVLAGELQKALEFFAWYEGFCADDTGEPLHYLFWALALYRTGDLEAANTKLLETMVKNVYFLPTLLGSSLAPYDMWHSSNREDPGYPAEIPKEYIPELSEEERSWIKLQLGSFRFRRVLDEYVSTFHALKTEKTLRNEARFWTNGVSSCLERYR